jgi:arsenite methyltransferase
VLAKYYGCGLTVPDCIAGKHILDLGSGSGRDCFVLSKLVGENGCVVGIDMTDAQLELAEKTIPYHTEKFGYKNPNVSFKKGYIEKLDAIGLAENSFDVAVSNCVINLCPDKLAVLRQIHRVLKPGGEFYFSDVYSDRRIPQALVNDSVLYGECLSGALYTNDFIRLARQAGFMDPRIVKRSPITIANKELQQKTGNIQFESITYRLFKIEGLEDLCEDFGQAVTYKGTLPASPNFFNLDDQHHFETGRASAVCGNTYRMLHASRFKEHFEYFGDMRTHHGLFPDCGSSNPNPSSDNSDTLSCC